MQRREREIDRQGTRPTIMVYDDDGYDYRAFWKSRDYEQWAESRILRRLFTQKPPLKAPELLAMGMKAAFLFGVGAGEMSGEQTFLTADSSWRYTVFAE